MREDLRREKELNLKLREELKRVEMERVKILEKIKELQHYSEQSNNNCEDYRVDLDNKTGLFEQMELEFKESIDRVEASILEIDKLRHQDEDNWMNVNALRESIKEVYSEKVDVTENCREL